MSNHWMIGLACMSLLAAMPLGCQAERSTATATAANSSSLAVAAPANGSATALAPGSLPPPPGVDARSLAPRQGEAATRSRLQLEQILPDLNQPSWMTVDPGTPALGQPPLMAQRAFTAARLAYREQQLDEAVRQLHLANSLAPRRPEILRLLGQIYQRRANAIRAAHYMEQVVVLEPQDVETILALGRFAMLQRNWEHAIAIFSRALQLLEGQRDELRPATMILVRYHLATALEQTGYDLAAVQQFRKLLTDPNWHEAEQRQDPQMLLLGRQRGLLWQQVGDAWHRLGESLNAMEAYNLAEATGVEQATDLIGRKVYTLLMLDRVDVVQDLLIEHLRHAANRDDSLRLIAYAHEHGLDRQALLRHLRQVYEQAPSPQFAVVIADMLDAEQAWAFLAQHLTTHPEDAQVLSRLVMLTFAAAPEGQPGPVRVEASEQLILTVARAITEHPQSAQPYAAMLAEARVGSAVLLQAIGRLTAAQQQDPMVRYIRAVFLVHAHELAAARNELEAVVQQKPDLVPARVQLAALLVHQSEHAQAERLLDALGDSDDPGVINLRVRILVETGQLEPALAMLDDLMARQPSNADWAIEKATIQLRMNDLAGAERTLWDAVNLRPEDERLYAILFQMYETGSLPDSHQQYTRLMRKLQGTIPHSRLARLKMIEFTRDLNERVTLLRALLQEDLADVEVLDQLLKALVEAGRRDEAETMLAERLKQEPGNLPLLRLASEHYEQRLRNPGRARELREQFLRLHPASAERDGLLADLLMQADRHDEAVSVLEGALERELTDSRELRFLASRMAKTGDLERGNRLFQRAITRFPAHEADLRYFNALLYDRHRQTDQSLQVLADLLVKFPDHPQANNHLGYSWANRGINLEQAKRMIQIALDADPNNAAYIDSMGWVHYKMGNFPEAVRRLRQAQAADQGSHPVILDHLGDALFRSGDAAQARQIWQQAERVMRNLSPEDIAGDSDMDGLGERLRAKIQALQAGTPPPVADVAPPAER